MQLQFDVFEKGKPGADFTFIPYGLESSLSKEAVKVHVLHGRKRARNTVQARSRQKPDGVIRGQVFAWDSKVVSAQKVKRSSKDGYETMGQPAMASVAQSPFLRQNLHKLDPRLSMDHSVLRNPFVDQIRTDLGRMAGARVESINYIVNHYLSRCSGFFPRELLSRYWQDNACFKAFLAHAAALFVLETGLPCPITFEELMCDALQEVRLRLTSSSQSHADGTVLAVALLANVEEVQVQRDRAARHWSGLRQLLRLRGTFSMLRLHRNLHAMLLWLEILTSNSSDFCLGHGIDDMPGKQTCVETMVSFFGNFANELSNRQEKELPDMHVQRFVTDIMFGRFTQHCHGECSMCVTQRRSSIACLVYLAMLSISASVSIESHRMLERIRDEVVERGRRRLVKQEEVLFVILNNADTEKEWRCQQLWQLSRCVFLTRKLETRDEKTIRDILSLYLGISDGCNDKVEVLKAWEKLSAEVLLEDDCGLHRPDLESSPNQTE